MPTPWARGERRAGVPMSEMAEWFGVGDTVIRKRAAFARRELDVLPRHMLADILESGEKSPVDDAD